MASETIQQGDQTITIQKIVPIEIPPLPKPSPLIESTGSPLPLAQEPRQVTQKQRLVILSCTVYDNSHTLVTWTSQRKNPVQFFKAWSNVNFAHFAALHSFKKNEVVHSLMLCLDHEDTQKRKEMFARYGKTYQAPSIPVLPQNSCSDPTFIIVEGEPHDDDLSTIEGLHEIYQDHHADLIAGYECIRLRSEKESRERISAALRPKPEIIIQHWNQTEAPTLDAVDEKGVKP